MDMPWRATNVALKLFQRKNLLKYGNIGGQRKLSHCHGMPFGQGGHKLIA